MVVHLFGEDSVEVAQVEVSAEEDLEGDLVECLEVEVPAVAGKFKFACPFNTFILGYEL